MGYSKDAAWQDLNERIARIERLADYQSGSELTIEYVMNRLRGDFNHQLVSRTLKEMHERGLVTEGTRAVGNVRYRTYTRRSKLAGMKWRKHTNKELGIEESYGIQGEYSQWDNAGL